MVSLEMGFRSLIMLNIIILRDVLFVGITEKRHMRIAGAE